MRTHIQTASYDILSVACRISISIITSPLIIQEGTHSATTCKFHHFATQMVQNLRSKVLVVQGSRRIYHILLTATCQYPYFTLYLCKWTSTFNVHHHIISNHIKSYYFSFFPFLQHTIMPFLFLPVLINIFVLMYVRISVLYVYIYVFIICLGDLVI